MEDLAAVGIVDHVADVEEPAEELSQLGHPLAGIARGAMPRWNSRIASLNGSPLTSRIA